MSDLFGDLRFALRSFRRAPLQVLTTVLILGVGVGAVTLMFSVLNASVLRPLPFREPGRLVWLWKASDEVRQNSLSYDDFRDYRTSLDALEDLAAYQVFYPRLLLAGTEEGTRVLGNQVTPNLFSVLGVAPALGRTFRWDEAVDGGPDVIILSHAFWQSRFGSDPSIVGRTVSLDGRPAEVVGVMPEGFAFPASGVQVWLPTREGEGATQGRGNNNFFAVGRLKDGVSLAAAQVQVDAVAARIQAANPDFAAWYHWLQPLHTVLFGQTRTTLLLLLGIVALVPLVACANVASLTLARATARTHELATRRALGAGRARVVGQLMVENVLLALLGGALGLGIAVVGGRVLRSVGPTSIPRLSEIGVDPTVLSFALLASLLTVPFFGIVPALRGAGFDLADALRFGSTRGGASRRGWSRSALVVTQVALSMTLLVTSGMLVRSLDSLGRVDPGFRVGSLLTARIELPVYKYASRQEWGLAWDQTMQRIDAIPGVQGVAVADWLPVTPGAGPWNGLSRPGRGGGEDQASVPGRRKFVSRDYFKVLGIPMLA
ncbi:MAG: ABC transporter permease, partial [Gemmatimonadetes bacterium]|nr:ABC transporter permease [Gemmatimonadota bacterium]